MGSGIWDVWNQYSLISTCIIGPFVVFGALANSFSLLHFYRKTGEGLGNVFLFCLNLADFAVSLVGIAVHVLPRLLKSSKILFLLGVIKTLAVFSIGADITRLITTYLSVIRTILVVKPLYRLHKRVIKVSFLILFSVILAYRLFVLVKSYIPMGELLHECFNFSSEIEIKCEIEESFSERVDKEEYINITIISSHTLIGTTCCIFTLLELFKPNENLGANRTTDTNRKAAHTTLILSFICDVLNVASIGCSTYMVRLEYVKDESYIRNALLATFLNMQFVPLNSALNPIVYIMRTSALRERVRDMWRRTGHCFRRVFVSKIHPPN